MLFSEHDFPFSEGSRSTSEKSVLYQNYVVINLTRTNRIGFRIDPTPIFCHSFTSFLTHPQRVTYIHILVPIDLQSLHTYLTLSDHYTHFYIQGGW